MLLFVSSPVILVTDAAVLGPKLDGVFLVVEAGKSSYHAVQRARSLLESVHARIMGVIFNRLNLEEAFGKFGYYHSYHIYYHEEGEKRKGEVGWFSSFKKKFRDEGNKSM
ncbi:MAG: hypothetical protein HY998_04455 [candidate division NC10 bacterium]|nr:hypothetical protein [candidate division NC10 bacterium]